MRGVHHRLSVILSTAVALAACATAKVEPLRPADEEGDHVLAGSYTVGKQESAYVGDQVLSVRDYYTVTKNTQVMSAERAFEVVAFSGGLRVAACKRPARQSIPIVGTARVSDSDYRVVEMCGRRYLVDSVGGLSGYGRDRVEVIPGDTRLREGTVTQVDTERGLINFELIYAGTNGSAFMLTYREYTPTDMVRTGFTQTLTYPADSKEIRFRSIRIAIHKVASDELQYTVLQDNSR